ncbi:TetR/AcrR family transcriptional regulator [Microbacterium sp. A93]|uniref:TetR/AcrR family transcriptional regulator n=1 Tax=Microbacterium sp. A93 TaxID=3450716 RepID=UPI003F437217
MTNQDVTAPPASARKTSRPISRKSGDERWEELLDVSARMFARHGYAATSLQQIADELGILKGSIYYYIKSKGDLLYEVIRSVYWDGFERFQSYSQESGTGLELLARAIEGHAVFLVEHLTATTVYLHEFERLEPARREQLTEYDYHQLVRDLIRRGQADGSVRGDVDPSIAALAILGSTNWIYRWYRAGSKSPEEIGSEFAKIFVTGLATG